ncbi:hypothetical protein MtrunA17_Chr3g0132481 [Medicago truncatula]|uniref:Uncharacterized protein n=1 Tax=Medicago truncatula TaxID=3880 RepID=A0A396IXG4_MEDTR|nr:hypothetical protein MtrunA17_Chr3g0132481 [Medicago truncatula]
MTLLWMSFLIYSGGERVFVKTKTPMNFLCYSLDGRSTLRQVDVKVYKLVGGKHAYVNLTGVLQLVRLGIEACMVGHTAFKATSSKVTKHKKTCSDNQHVLTINMFYTICV